MKVTQKIPVDKMSEAEWVIEARGLFFLPSEPMQFLVVQAQCRGSLGRGDVYPGSRR